jgi:hypothetical protein
MNYLGWIVAAALAAVLILEKQPDRRCDVGASWGGVQWTDRFGRPVSPCGGQGR